MATSSKNDGRGSDFFLGVTPMDRQTEVLLSIPPQ
jgi:hypothetical protein